MSIIPKKNPHDLTDDEIAYLRSTVALPEVRKYVARRQDNLGVETSALNKVAANARAKCLALEAIRDLDAIQGYLVDLGEALAKLDAADKRARSLEATLSQKDQRIMQLTAGPAMAVSGD